MRPSLIGRQQDVLTSDWSADAHLLADTGTACICNCWGRNRPRWEDSRHSRILMGHRIITQSLLGWWCYLFLNTCNSCILDLQDRSHLDLGHWGHNRTRGRGTCSSCI